MKKWLFVGCCLLFAGYTLAQDAAQAPADTLALQYLQEVIVSTRRTETLLYYTPAAVERLARARMQTNSPRTTPEALMAIPGVFVQKTNHGGGSAFVRGLTGNQTLLLIDGIRLSNATFRYGPNQYLNTIDPFTIGHIEVWKSGGSAPYGSDALGGVIQVFTQSPDLLPVDGKPHIKLLGQWRSPDMEQTGRLEAGLAGKKLAILGGVTLRRFGDLVGGKNTGVQSPSGYDEYAYDFKGRWHINKTMRLTLAHQFFEQTDVPIYHKIQLENFALNHISLQSRQLSYASLSWRPDSGNWLQEINATASFQQSDEHRDIQKNGSATLRQEADKVQTWGANLLAVFQPAHYWQATAGVEYYHDLVRSARTDTDLSTQTSVSKRGLYPDGATYGNAAIFCVNEWISGRWRFSGGLRYNIFAVNLTDETLGEVRLHPSAVVWNAAVMRQIAPGHQLFANYNSGFRAPNIDDLGTLGIVDFRYEIPTDDLQAEKSDNTELGWRFMGQRVQSALYVYNNQLHNLITRVQIPGDTLAGYPVYRKENVEKGYIRGIEGQLSIWLAAKWQAEAAMAWQYGQNQTQNEPLRRIPPVFGRLGLRYKAAKWQLTLEALAAGKQNRLAASDKADNRIPAGGTPGWWALNAYGQYTHQWLSLRAGVYNIGNADYRYHGSGVNAPGRHLATSLTLAF